MGGKIAGLGYIPAGYSGFRGLGDAAYDAAMAQYQSDHSVWQRQANDYAIAQSNYQTAMSSLHQDYINALSAYQADLAKWTAEKAAYTAAYNAASNQNRTTQMTLGMQQNSVLQQYPSIVIPQGYAGCVSQAQHDAWAATCSAMTSVRGLGAAVPTGPECGLAQLPVCPFVVPMPAPLRPQPAPPPAPRPLTPPTPPGPEPQPPAAPPPSALGPPPQQIPASNPSPGPSVTQNPYSDTTPLLAPSPTATAAPTASAGLLSNGLLLVALAGGSYLLYRSLKKPKPKAA